MSQIKREMERIEALHAAAGAAAKQAEAVKACDFHSDCLLAQWDDDANRRAYAIGTKRWNAGEIDGTREEFMDAIKEVIETAPDDCPDCDRATRD